MSSERKVLSALTTRAMMTARDGHEQDELTNYRYPQMEVFVLQGVSFLPFCSKLKRLVASFGTG